MSELDNTLQIETKLGKETANFTLLKDHVDKYQMLTKTMSNILNSFEKRLGKLEETILPVYNETEHLQSKQKNLDSTLQFMEQVLSHYDTSQDVCNLIHMGPSEGNILSFLNGLDKLKRAKEYFFYNNPQSVELENVTSLFNNGCETLNNYFKSLLKKYTYIVKPVDLLDLIYIEEDSSNEECSSIKQLPITIRKELNIISNWLEYNLRREYINIYADERSDVILRSLQLLKDHQKSGSWGHEVLKSRNFGTRTAETIASKKTTSSRLQQIFEKKANKMLKKASQTLEQSTGIVIKKQLNINDGNNFDDYNNYDNNEQELDKYIILLLGLQRLLILERNILNDVIPVSRHSEVFTKLSQNSIDMIIKDAETIQYKILRNISRKEWSNVLGIYSTIKHVILLQPDIDKACDLIQKKQLSLILKKLQNTGAKALEQFLEVVKGDTGTNIVGMPSSNTSYTTGVPKDATVHELTSNTIWFIEHLYEHYDVIGGILQTDQIYINQLEQITMNKVLSADDKNKAFLGLYIKKILSELNLTIVSKCEQYNDAATKLLFRLNNIHYILKSLQRTNLIYVLFLTENDCEKNYIDLINELKLLYINTWSRLLNYVQQLDDMPRIINGKIKDKERYIIKERFSNFNKELEDACKIQKCISVPDVILREGLKRDNNEYIIPVYNTFFELYSDIQFSKSPEKYIKYKPQDVTAMLNNLFDDTV